VTPTAAYTGAGSTTLCRWRDWITGCVALLAVEEGSLDSGQFSDSPEAGRPLRDVLAAAEASMV